MEKAGYSSDASAGLLLFSMRLIATA